MIGLNVIISSYFSHFSRSRDEEHRDSSRDRNQRDDIRRRDDNRGRRSPERRDDNRKSPERRDDSRRSPERRDGSRRFPERREDSRRSPERRDDNRRNRSPQERRRYEDSRNDRRDNDRRNRSRSRDRPPHNDRDNRDNRRGGFKQRRYNDKEEDDGNFEWGKRDIKKDPEEAAVEKDKPNFGLSGKLTEETNKVNGIVIKYAEPPEAKVPKRRWRLYPFKGETALPTLYIHRQSAFLIGRDRKVCDLNVDHPSCSKQHAAIQYRLVPYEREDGSTGKRVRPYIIDLESANGTFVNNKKIDAKKYVELLEKDVIKFGYSSREYVMLHEASKDEAEDDEVADDEPETAN